MFVEIFYGGAMEQYLPSDLFVILKPWYPTIGVAIFWFLFYLCYKKIIVWFLRSTSAYFSFFLGTKMLDACEKYIDRIIFLIGFYYSLTMLPYAWTQNLGFMRSLFGTFGWICVFCACFKAINIVKPFFSELLGNRGVFANDSLANIIAGIVRIVISMVCICLIAKEWNFDIVGFMASVSIVSVAVAYAGKDALANIFGGLIIIVDKSFLVGDWISVNGVEGIVEKITFRSTYVRTFPQELVVVPNNLLINTPITNYSKRGKRRIDMTIGLTYSTTRVQMENFIAAVKEYLLSNDKILHDDIRVNFVNYNDSSLDVSIVCYTNETYLAAPAYLEVVSEINLALMSIIEKCEVSCAFPTRSVYFENNPK